MLPFFRQRKEKDESSLSFENGSSLLEELLASFGARYENPIRSFTMEELIRATENFSKRIVPTDYDYMFQGFLEERQILVQRYYKGGLYPQAIRDIAVSSQMSHLKNVLKLRGCCLEFKVPALVYEYAGTELVTDRLFDPKNEKLLTWRNRVQIAKGVANTIAYLHNAFATPIIYRDLKPSKVIIDKDSTPKLFDFSLSIKLPPGESQIEDTPVGTLVYADPEYIASGILTEKSDVYSIGVFLLVLLTGKRAFDMDREEPDIVNYVKYYIEKDQLSNIPDPRILEEEGNVKQEKQLKGFLDLAMKCTQASRPDRPDMIQVAKEIGKMEKCASFDHL